MDKYLVRGKIAERQYMKQEDEVFEDMAFVEAFDEADAEYRYEKHWSAKTQEYSVYYRVLYCETVRTI